MRRIRFEIGGEVAAVRDDGAGEPIVLLPSQLVIARAYVPTIAALAKSFRVITVEMPGVGGASKLAKPWDEKRYADWLAEFLVATKLARAPIIGHSNSAAALVALAAKYPQLAGKLVLADPVGADPTHSLLRVFLGRAIDAAIEFDLSITGWPHLLFNLAYHPANFLRQIKLAVDADVLDLAKRVQAPTLLAWGRRDFTMRPAWSQRLLDTLPNRETYWARAGSHDWLITHPQEFAAAVNAFAHRPVCIDVIE